MASTTYLQQAYLAYFGRPADVSGLSFYADKTEAQVVTAFSASAESQAFFGSLNTLAQINTIYQNLFNRAAEPAGLTYWAGEINAGRLSLAQASMGILAGAQNADKLAVTNKLAAAVAFTAALDTSDEMIGYQGTSVITSARAYLASVDSTAASLTAATATAALNASVATVVTAGTTSSTAGSTFTLTTSTDTFTGTAGNDTFNAAVHAQTAASNTLDAFDNINGGAGTGDMLLITSAGTTANTLGTASISNFETMTVRASSTGGFTGALAGLGFTTVNNDRSTDAVTFTGLAAGGVYAIQGNAATTNGASALGYASSATAGTLNISGGTTAGAITITGSGLTSQTINSTGATNIVGAITVAATTTALTINATTGLGSTAQQVGAALKTITVTGAAATGTTQTAAGSNNAAVKLGTLAATVTTVDASAMTAGGVSTTLVAAVTSFKGGQGADAVTTVALTDSATASIIDGGSGTDTLVVAAYANINSATLAKQYANFEVVDSGTLTGTAINMALFTNSTITGLAIGASAAASFSNVTAAQAANVRIYGDAATTTTIALLDASTNGNLDTLTLSFNDGLSAVDTLTLASVVAVGTETINVVATDNAEISSLAASTSFTGMTVTGAGTVSITTAALAANTNSVINASAATGAFTYVGTLATANGLKVTGSATAANSFTGATATTLGDTFIGGAVADTFVNNVTGQATTGGDVFTGGGGADTFVLRGNVAAGAATTIYATATRITDFTVGSGGDILSLSTLAANYTAGTGLGNSFMTAATAVAAGATVITTIGNSSAGAAITAGTSLVKLSQAVADTTGLQTMFNSAIGTSTFTVTEATEGFFSLYDSTNSRMVIGLYDAGAGNTAVATGDVVTLIGTINMTAADYALFSASNLSLLAA